MWTVNSRVRSLINQFLCHTHKMQRERSQLEKEVNSLWSNELHELPVYKDLPRLAGRITIIGDLGEHQTQHYEEEYIDTEPNNENNNSTTQ